MCILLLTLSNQQEVSMNTHIFGSQQLLDAVRAFNKRVYNPLIRSFAGIAIYAVIWHLGRTSGRIYVTPVVAGVTSTAIVIPLPYGATADWCRNVLARQRCALTVNRQTLIGSNPTIVPAAKALPVFSTVLGWALQRAGIEQYLYLQRD
jgi:hypothetical protein